MEAPLRPAISSLGIIPFKSAATLAEEETAKQEALKPPAPYVGQLSGHIETCWSAARVAKRHVELQMLKSLRQRNGIYEHDKLNAIKKMGGSEVYVLLTATKCRAAEAWINDIFRASAEQPWSADPTPVPDLPGDKMEEIKMEVMAVAQQIIGDATMLLQQIPDTDLIQELKDYATSRKDEVMAEIKEEAKVRAERMTAKMADQLAEGGWDEAFWGVISDFVTLKGAVLKGPVLRKRKVQKWVQEGGRWAVRAKDEIVPEFDRVSPFDIYPAPDSRGPDDGYIIERHRISRSELQAMIGVPGYSEKAIREVLNDYGTGLTTHEGIDSEREMIEFNGETGVFRKGEKIEALEFWGSVQGRMLIEWGMPSEGLDPDLDYEVNAWKVGAHVIRAILNPDLLGRKPYSVESYERVAGSFWGKGIPELMQDIQDICNALARAIVNNAGLASGPQVDVNIERVSNSEDIYPWKIWQATNQQMTEAPAVRFNQPQVITDQLLRVFEFFAALSEDSTGVPRWAYGNSDIGGAGATSSGLSMLMTHASRGIKESISHVDAMISGCIERLYDYNMAYDEDEDIKGDCRIVARGSTSLVAKEQQVVRMRELLGALNNPADLQITGLEGRAKLLRSAIKGLELEVDGIIPDEAGVRALVEKIEQQQAAMQQAAMQQQALKGGTPPPGSQSLDPAGNPAGGVDANLFQNQPGVSPGLGGAVAQ